MNFEEAALQFLATEENLPVALEIAAIVERMKVRYHREFWRGLEVSLRAKLQRTSLASHWKTQFNHNSTKFKADWFSCRFVPASLASDQNYLRVSLEQGRRAHDYPLYYGVARLKLEQRKKEVGLAAVYSLSHALQERGFKDDGNWWLGIKRLNYSIAKSEFLLCMANDQSSFIEEMAQNVWSLFEENADLITAANQALAEPAA